jgi:hypothetical protein
MFSASKTSGPSGYNLTNSLRFRASASAFLSRTPGTAGNRRTWTWSGWIKRGSITANSPLFTVSQDSANFTVVRFGPGTTDKLEVYTIRSSVDYSEETVALFRDPSAWYHVVFSVDTTQATASNRIRIYVNGVQQSTTQFYGQIPQNEDTFVNTTNSHNICRNTDTTTQHFDGYLDEVNFIDGQALTPSSFGSTNATTGVWQPARYTGTYGTNGFYLNFTDIALTSGSNAGLGRDFSGNGNFWNTNNISVTAGTTYDAMSDVPTLTSATVANYCVWNTLDNFNSLTISNGNLTAARATTASWASSRATFSMPSGKWYWEVTSGGGTTQVGILRTDVALTADSAANAFGYIYNANDGYRYNDGNSFAYGSAYNTSGDVVGVAWDADTGTLTFYKNGTSQGTAWSGLSGTYSPVISIYGTITTNANFGQRPFAYTPPTGFVALNTFNLPTSTIVKGSSYMDAYIYTGDGNSTRTITFPIVADFVWSKNRTTANDNVLIDTVRGGTSPVRALFSNATTAEITTTAGWGGFGYPDSLSGTSYAVVKGTQATSYTNKLNDSYVNWLWQAGQGSTSSNTSGSITSTVSVNTTAGFSIVTYTGTGTAATVGHGLGVAPKMVIVKNRVQGTYGNWTVWHTTLTGSQYLALNATTAIESNNNRWNGTVPTSTVFSLGADSFGNTNKSGDTYVAYCWAEIAGFSKFGSYTGNGSADGTFVFTGFLPKYILIKASSFGGLNSDWFIYDTARNPYNTPGNFLCADLSQAEASGVPIDCLANGFKLRGTGSGTNSNGATYIFAAFASNPFKNTNAF